MLNHQRIRVLTIDLTHKRFGVSERKDLFELIGGVGVGIQLLNEQLDPQWEIFDKKQPIIFSIGPMEGIYPVTTKVAALFRSPLTGELGESYAGLRLGMAMRFAGYDAIVITGRAEGPTWLYIDHKEVVFHDAYSLWGLDTEETGRFLRQAGNEQGLRSIIRIGQAGENLIRFANINVDIYRHFGRLGLGALFGSKYLKGIVIHGNTYVAIKNKQDFQKVYQDIYRKVIETDRMDKYRYIGTAVNILPLNKLQALPTKNLQENSFEFAEEISGEAFMEEKLTRKIACTGCPIGCIHLGLYRKEFGEPKEYTYKEIAYDYEPIFALGSYLGIRDKNQILALIEMIELAGLDCIATGVLLGWMTEAYKKGILDEEQTQIPLAFGDVYGYKKAITNIANKKNKFYEDLGKGTQYAASKYGGKEFAGILGGHEMAGYHTGYGNLLGIAVGARHSHLDNGGYAIDQKIVQLDKEKLVELLIKEEIERNIYNCLVICLFARKVYDIETIVKAFNAIGIKTTAEELYNVGKRIFAMKIAIKKKLGFEYRNIQFPKRYFETKTPHGQLDESIAEELLNIYVDKMEALCGEISDLFLRVDQRKKLI